MTTGCTKAMCPTHGEYTSHKLGTFGSRWSNCPSCEEAAAIHEQTEKDQRDRELREKMMRDALKAAAIPPRFEECWLGNFLATTQQQKDIYLFCSKFADECVATGRSTLFVGSPGTGKTHLAIAIARKIMPLHTAYYTTVQRFIRRVKDTWAQTRTETEKAAMAAATTVDLLILDEVGVQHGSQFEEHLLFDVLNERYEHRRPTILISNLPPEKAKAFLGERVVDRLRQDGGSVQVFDWPSARGAK